MSRTRLIAALLISITLIAGAGWFRFARTQAFQAQLVAVQQVEQSSSEDVFLESILEVPVAAPAIPTEPLSTADMVSRQLFSDYIALDSQGQINPQSIEGLAGRYAGSILGQTLSARKIELDQILMIPDSEENFSQYGQSILAIRTKYKDLAEKQYHDSDVGDLNSQGFKTFISASGKLYESSAQELLSIATPVSLAQNHRALINNHFESAVSMYTLAKMSEDPLTAYAAMNTQSQNSKEESGLLLKIQTTLMANGIILERGL